jgi:uncharacterized phiE125 gp8 family phage protein
MSSWTIINPPVVPTTWVSDAKKHLEIAESDKSHDNQLCKLIELAVENVQADSNRAVLTQVVSYRLDKFPSQRYIQVPYGKLASVTTLNYTDTDGVGQTWASSNYEVDTERNRIWTAYNVTWPAVRWIQNAITVTYVAGEANASIPRSAWHAVMLQVAHAFENREPILIGSISKELEQSYRTCINRFALGDGVVI